MLRELKFLLALFALQALPSIGVTKARAIAFYRTTNTFNKIDELDEIDGICLVTVNLFRLL